ncbi:hypothetical protein T439DRAFT_378465 [Meredithblackwellia eburnea MCA 4105]
MSSGGPKVNYPALHSIWRLPEDALLCCQLAAILDGYSDVIIQYDHKRTNAEIKCHSARPSGNNKGAKKLRVDCSKSLLTLELLKAGTNAGKWKVASREEDHLTFWRIQDDTYKSGWKRLHAHARNEGGVGKELQNLPRNFAFTMRDSVARSGKLLLIEGLLRAQAARTGRQLLSSQGPIDRSLQFTCATKGCGFQVVWGSYQNRREELTWSCLKLVDHSGICVQNEGALEEYCTILKDMIQLFPESSFENLLSSPSLATNMTPSSLPKAAKPKSKLRPAHPAPAPSPPPQTQILVEKPKNFVAVDQSEKMDVDEQDDADEPRSSASLDSLATSPSHTLALPCITLSPSSNMAKTELIVSTHSSPVATTDVPQLPCTPSSLTVSHATLQILKDEGFDIQLLLTSFSDPDEWDMIQQMLVDKGVGLAQRLLLARSLRKATEDWDLAKAREGKGSCHVKGKGKEKIMEIGYEGK